MESKDGAFFASFEDCHFLGNQAKVGHSMITFVFVVLTQSA
jgi:hypothetical protein